MQQVLLAAALLTPAGDPGGGRTLTTEQLHARSPLAAALHAEVRPPSSRAPRAEYDRAPSSRAPATPATAEGVGTPGWLRLLTPRSASATVTAVAGDDLSTSAFDLRSTHGLPGVPPFVTVTPGLNLLSTNGPTTENFPAPGPDLPARLWGVDADVAAFMPLSERWSVQAAVSPGLFTDFDNTSGDAFRIPGRLLGIYKYSPRTQFTVGAVYLDREDVTWLPALGVIHQPNDRTTLEFVLPRPRVVQRLGWIRPEDSAYVYLAGELGGGSWAIERADGAATDDIATLSDLRLLAGLEAKNDGQVKFLAETGWVFGRDIEYASGVGGADFDDAWLFRVGLRK